MQTKRYLGLDYGKKSIGVSIGCPESRVATGLTTIRRSEESALKQSISSLRDIIRKYDITHIVLGNPLNMDGSMSSRTLLTHTFKEKLQRNFKSKEIILWDERLSTSAVTTAFNVHHETKGSKKRKEIYRAHVDEMAAVYILQGYLNRQMEVTMDNENLLPNENDSMGDIIVVTDDDGNEYPFHVLASKEHEGDVYLLAIIAEDDEDEDDDDETVEVMHFKCSQDDSDDEMSLETIDEAHEDFELVMKLFKDDYDELGITVDEGDPFLGA